MARIAVRTLGTVAIDLGERSLGPSAGRAFALLFYLTARRGQPTPRRVLQELLFPPATDPQAGHRLRQLVYRLRQQGVPIHTDADGVEIRGEDVWVDWQDLLERGELGTPDLEWIAKGLFPGYTPDDSAEYRDWFESERSAVRLRLSRAVGLQLTQLRRAGRWDLVDVASRALLALDPLSEEGTLARAEALAASGSKTAALRVIDDYLAELGDDQAKLRLTPNALRRRISERLPELGSRAQEDRIFVGREDAMRMLSAAGSAARVGTQQTVLVWGEPGIGKTRLLAEYKALACLQGAVIFEAACQPHDVFRPLGILSDLVGQLLEAPGALGCDPAKRRILAQLVAPDDATHADSDRARGELSLSAIISAVDDLLSAIAGEMPLLLLLDDAHWLDRSSLTAIAGACSARTLRRSCVVLASRERCLLSACESLPDNVLSVRVAPLSRRSALELVRSALRNEHRCSDELEEQILREGRGNPFFLRHLCRHIQANDEGSSLGQTIAEVLGRRLEHLSLEATRVLEAAAVLGKNCTYGRLAAVLEMTRFELLRAIEELDDCGLIEVHDGCYVSSHALLADAVVDRMSSSVKRALHASAADVLQSDFDPSQGGSLPWDCAEHWRVAEDHTRAVAVLRSCAERSLAAGRPADALTTYKRALSLNSPDGVRCELLEGALSCVSNGIDWTEALSLLPELETLRARTGQPRAAHNEIELIGFATVFHAGRDPRIIVPKLQSCIESAEASNRHRLAAGRLLLMIAELNLDAEAAASAFHATRQLAPGTPQQVLCDLLYHICFGDVRIAGELADRLASTSSSDRDRLALLLNAGYAQYRLGCWNAEDSLRRALTAAKQTGTRTAELHAYLFLASYCWDNGRYEACEQWLQQLASLDTQTAEFDAMWEYELLSARLAIRDGRADQAAEALKRARLAGQSALELPALLINTCALELRHAEGSKPCAESELSEILWRYRKARNIGRQDDATAAIVVELERQGRRKASERILRDYLTLYRRDGFPIGPKLIKLLGCLENEVPCILRQECTFHERISQLERD